MSSSLVLKVVSHGITINLLISHDVLENFIKNGSALYSDKRDGYSPSPAFFLLLTTYLVFNILLSKQGVCALSEGSCPGLLTGANSSFSCLFLPS